MHRRSRSRTELPRREQRSVWYVPEGHDEASARFTAWRSLHYVSMFVEDLGLHVLPPGMNRNDEAPLLTVDPDDKKVEGLLAMAFDPSYESRGFGGDLDYHFATFIRLMMAELCSYPEVSYEVVFLYEKDAPKPSGFQLVHLNPFQVRKEGGNLVQTVPEDTAKEYGVSTAILLPKEDVVNFTLPKGIRRKIKRTMEGLAVLSGRNWSDMSLDSINGKLPYDFSIHKRSMNLALAEVCGLTGWTARGSFHKVSSPAFWIRREVEFHKFAIDVRMSIIRQINELLSRIGPRISMNAQIKVAGGRSKEDLDRAVILMDEGRASFSEVLDMVNGYRPVDPSKNAAAAPGESSGQATA